MCRRSLGFSCSCAEPRRAVQQLCAVGGRPSWAPARSAAGLRASPRHQPTGELLEPRRTKGYREVGKGREEQSRRVLPSEHTWMRNTEPLQSQRCSWGRGVGTAAAEQRCQCPRPPGDSTGGCPLATTVQGRREGEICPLPSSFRCMTQELPCWSHGFQFKCWRNMLRG